MSILSRIDQFVENELCHTIIGQQIMKVLRSTGISSGIRKHIVYRMMDNGTYPGDIEKSKKFFEENEERINRICNWLSDEESRNTYRQAIAFRMTLNRSDLPKYHLKDEQYFDEIVKFHDEEVFVDCGSYIGDTVDSFRKRVSNYKYIVCFEPDEHNYKVLLKKKIPNLQAIHGGVYNENTHLIFEAGNATGSTFVTSESSTTKRVRVYKIDSVPQCNGATFIKMDVEGSELAALKGAEKTIQKNHPKLAICIYHSDEDMVSIAEYIHIIAPQYKLYVRHYSYEKYETVLYAV